MPFKNPEDKRKYYQDYGPEYRAAKAAEIKARQKAWYQANKERLRLKEQANSAAIARKRRARTRTGAEIAVQVLRVVTETTKAQSLPVEHAA